MQTRTGLIIALLVLVYVGPYAFVFGRTATWTFPRIDVRDFEAMDGVESSVGTEANLTNTNPVGNAQEATYSLKAGVLHRKFLDWIGFPLVLEVNNFTFKGTGIYQNKVVFECSQFETAFPKPTGKEPWYIYQPLVDKNDNTYVNISCSGDAAAFNPANVGSVNFIWSMSANLVGDRNEKLRSWNGSEQLQVEDLRAL